MVRTGIADTQTVTDVTDTDTRNNTVMARLNRDRIPVFREASVGIEDFRAVYDVFQCVCFKPKNNHPHRHLHRSENDRRVGNQTKTTEGIGRSGNRKQKQKRQRQRQRKHQGKRQRISNDDARSAVAASSPSPSVVASPDGGFGVGILDTIRKAYESASPRDQKSWNVENDCNNRTGTESPSEFLSSGQKKDRKRHRHRDVTSNNNGYCSFVLQDDSNGAVTNFSNTIQHIVTESGSNAEQSASNGRVLPQLLLLLKPTSKIHKDAIGNPIAITMAPHYWIFVGRNHIHGGSGSGNGIENGNDVWDEDRDRASWLSGRKEHTDSIEHDGTFHHQLLGRKLWKLRPTLELRDKCDRDYDLALLDSYEVLVEEGDVFVINTRLWWHQTEIPPSWSVSYARDLYLGVEEEKDCSNEDDRSSGVTAPTAAAARDRHPTARESGVGNVEVSWAAGFIPKGTNLVVDEIVGDDGDGETRNNGSNKNGDEEDEDKVASLYHHLVPPTIRRTVLESRANCKLVILAIEPRPDGEFFESEDGGKTTKTKDTASSSEASAKQQQKQTPRLRQVALETIRDIQEGEEFVLLWKKKKT